MSDQDADTDAATDHAPERRGGGRFAGATLLTIAAVSTLSQYLAAASQGLQIQGPFDWSTGGAVALVSMAAMWIWCRTWASWRAWIWLPVIVTVIVAFVTVNLAATSARGDGALSSLNEPAPVANCLDMERQLSVLEREYQAALDVAYVDMPFGNRSTPPTPQPAGGTFWGEESDAFFQAQYDRWVGAGGPALERELRALEAEYQRDC